MTDTICQARARPTREGIRIMKNRHSHYEEDVTTFPADAYHVRGYDGIAFYVLGWETEPDEDTEWSGYEIRTGLVLAIMVGDDRRHRIDPDDLTPIDRADYCGECGQIGCTCDGYPRDDDEDTTEVEA